MNSIIEDKEIESEFWNIYDKFILFLEDRLRNINIENEVNLFEQVFYIGNEFYREIITYIIDERLFSLQFLSNGGVRSKYITRNDPIYKMKYKVYRQLDNIRRCINYRIDVYFPLDYSFSYIICIDKNNYNIIDVHILEYDLSLAPNDRLVSELDVTDDVIFDN